MAGIGLKLSAWRIIRYKMEDKTTKDEETIHLKVKSQVASD